ncbi:hypothetical protein NQ317_016660 [Molorchus minor]|uniref:Uncharacterized protein n=1 Tax=Molorchus minor TaxID=1323400 RepID=A0ABQ9JQM8_9CUCU|nr:hypothetical protein NQ317_016660 [Molorchus minor]
MIFKEKEEKLKQLEEKLQKSTLKNLEQISNEIHEKRQGVKAENDLLKRPREPGVGAELNSVFEEVPAIISSKHFISLPDISLELEKFDACSIRSVSAATSSAVSEKDEDEHLEELEDKKQLSVEKNNRSVEGKSEDIFVSEYQLAALYFID